MSEEQIEIQVRIKQLEIDTAIKKAKKLRRLLKEANSLIKELASYDSIKMYIEF